MPDTKRQARDSYKERTARAGIYALHCGSQMWAGTSTDLDKIENQLLFSLRLGSHPHRALQAAFAAHGARFEIVEVLDDADDFTARQIRLRRRLDHWLGVLGAKRI